MEDAGNELHFQIIDVNVEILWRSFHKLLIQSVFDQTITFCFIGFVTSYDRKYVLKNVRTDLVIRCCIFKYYFVSF